jgi:hypothetical protein
VQATVYLCGPIASIWNLRAQTVPGEAYRRRFAERRRRAQRRRRAPWAPFQRPAAAALTALCVGGATSAFVAPASLLHVKGSQPPAVSAQASAGTEVYVKLGSSYHAIGSAHLSNLTLSFHTSSPVLLGEVLRAAANGGRISHVSLAFRAPGSGGRSATQRVDTFATATVAFLRAHLSGTPAGSVSLLLSPRDQTTSTPGTLKHVGPFAPASAARTAQASVTLGGGLPSYAVTAASVSQAAAGAPLELRFTTSAQPLLRRIFRARGGSVSALTLSVRDGAGAGLLRYGFSGLRTRSLTQKRSGSLSGTATLAARPR